MKATGLVLIFGLLTRAFAAPVDINVDKKGGPRVSTKEILNLEQQLKAQAGEDKKFFPSEMQKSKHVPPQQQVDGLEEHNDEEEKIPGIPAIPAQQDPVAAQMETEPSQALLNLDDDAINEQLLEPVPGQLDLAQQDELEAAQKRDHNENAIDDDENMMEGKDVFLGKDMGLDLAMASEAEAEAEQEAAEEEAEEEAEGQREDEEALFMQSVIEALRDRPDLLQQFLEGRLDDAVPDDTRVPARAEDEADRADVIRAEYLAATRGRGGPEGGYIPSQLLQEQELAKPLQAEALRELEESDSPSVAEQEEQEEQEERQLAQQRYAALENFQNYRGDKEARVVKKSYKWAAVKKEADEEDSDESKSSETSSNEDDSNSESQEEDQSKESEENELKEARKRVDMSQHLSM